MRERAALRAGERGIRYDITTCNKHFSHFREGIIIVSFTEFRNCIRESAAYPRRCAIARISPRLNVSVNACLSVANFAAKYFGGRTIQ